MAKIQVLVILSLDGCLPEQYDAFWEIHPDKYGIDKIRENAMCSLYENTSLSMLISWSRREDDSTVYLIEGTPQTAELINGMLRMHLIDEIILYTVPFIAGTGKHFFRSALPFSHWQLTALDQFEGRISCAFFHKRDDCSI